MTRMFRTPRMREDCGGIAPVIIAGAIGLAALFGLGAILTPWDTFWSLTKVLVVSSLLFVFGVLTLMGRFVVLPKPFAILIGLAAIGGGIWYMMTWEW